MAVPIFSRIYRGSLYFQIADLFCPIVAWAARAWPAVEAHRFDTFEPTDELIVQPKQPRTGTHANLRVSQGGAA